MKWYKQIISACSLLVTCSNMMYSQTDYLIQNIAVHAINYMCEENSAQLPIKINQTDTFTAIDISDGFLTYYFSSTLSGEELDYIINNQKLIHDNIISQILSNPSTQFIAALCVDATIGMRYIYTFPEMKKNMNVEVLHSTLTEILPYTLNQDGRRTYAKEYFTAVGAPFQISNDYFTIYERTDNSSYLNQYLNEKDMAELTIDAFMEQTPSSIVNLVCLWTGMGLCVSFVNEDNSLIGERSCISYDKLKETYLYLYPSSLHQLRLVDKHPKFLDGNAYGFSEWVNAKLIYPKEAMENGIQGRVILTFTIGKDGYIKDIQVIGNPDKSLAKEATRVVSSSPKWTPGEKDNKKVSVSYTFPVIFQLQ